MPPKELAARIERRHGTILAPWGGRFDAGLRRKTYESLGLLVGFGLHAARQPYTEYRNWVKHRARSMPVGRGPCKRKYLR